MSYSLCFVLVRPTFFVYTPPARYSLPGTSTAISIYADMRCLPRRECGLMTKKVNTRLQ